MKLIKALQKNIQFSFCPHPVTIDKSAEWGEGNIQKFPNGVYLKHSELGEITHGVQPCQEVTERPEGWIRQGDGLFKKKDVWFIEELAVGQTKPIETLDGRMEYLVAVPSSLVCQNINGEPNLKDSWIIPNKDLAKLYDLESIR